MTTTTGGAKHSNLFRCNLDPCVACEHLTHKLLEQPVFGRLGKVEERAAGANAGERTGRHDAVGRGAEHTAGDPFHTGPASPLHRNLGHLELLARDSAADQKRVTVRDVLA